jgi:hypothetical protein
LEEGGVVRRESIKMHRKRIGDVAISGKTILKLILKRLYVRI